MFFGGQVDDILGEESDNDSEGKEKEEKVEGEEEDETSRQSAETTDYQQTLDTSVKNTSASKEDNSRTGSAPRYCTLVTSFRSSQGVTYN